MEIFSPLHSLHKQLLKNTPERSLMQLRELCKESWKLLLFYFLFHEIFSVLSVSSSFFVLRWNIHSVIKRIYSCFMKIVNSYFSITMIFPFIQFTFSSLLFLYFSLPWISLMLFCGVGCCFYMCLLVVHFSSSFDFTLHIMQNSFFFESFYRL